LIEPIEPGRRHRRRGLTDKQVAALPRKRKRYIISDPELRGHYIRVPVDGPAVFVCEARDPYRKQIWVTIGGADKLGIEQSRSEAREIIARIKKGLPPREAPPVKPDTFEAVAENWLKRYVAPKGLRTAAATERLLRGYILPHWRDRPFVGIKRADIAKLGDFIEDHHGPRQSDIVVGIVRQICNWFALRDSDYLSPFVRGMRRHGRKSRDRVLDDAELRAVWKAAADAGRFGALVKFLLLCGQRKAVVLAAKRSDINSAGLWTIPQQPRAKGDIERVQLPAQALAVVRAQPKLAGNEHLFPALRGARPLAGLSRFKKIFDARAGVTGWVLHDLRRTARSLMSRAGVPRDHAERVLGHSIGSDVEKTYDRHRYDLEKQNALASLAALIDQIISDEPSGKVLRLKKARADA